MFGLISKKKLKKYMEAVKDGNRASKMGASYTNPISEEQRKRNLYLQGYEDGTDNFFHAVRARFDIR